MKNSNFELAISQRVTASRLALDYITIDPRLQSRELKPAVVTDYSKAMRRGEVFPPVRLVRHDRDTYYLVDGHHRVAATRQLGGVVVISAEIVNGTFNDALWHSWGANRGHGLRRTREDKHRAIRAALNHPNWSKKSNREIARHIGCDHKTVIAIRHILAGEFPKSRAKAGRSARSGPSEGTILQASTLLASIHPSELYQFDSTELVVVRNAYEALHQLLSRTELQPKEEQQTVGSVQGGVNAGE